MFDRPNSFLRSLSRFYQCLPANNVGGCLLRWPEDADVDRQSHTHAAGFGSEEDILGRDTDEQKAVALAGAAVIGKNPDLVNTDLDRYLKVTAADIQRAAKEYFVPQHATVLIITPAAPAH